MNREIKSPRDFLIVGIVCFFLGGFTKIYLIGSLGLILLFVSFILWVRGYASRN